MSGFDPPATSDPTTDRRPGARPGPDDRDERPARRAPRSTGAGATGVGTRTRAAQASPRARVQVATIGNLMSMVGAYLPEPDQARIRDAYRLSDAAHLGQFRSSGEPYICHPIAVAEICAGWKLDAESIMAALLHDTLEDSGVSKTDLHERFGSEVAELVDGLSKIERIAFSSREMQQAESFRKMLLAMARDVRVILIKLADRLHNMQTLEAVSPTRRRRIATETLDIYAPIASRLGLYRVYNDLLDLAFKHQFPMRYRVLRKAVQAARGNRREVLARILEAVQRALPEVGITAEIVSREKSIYGIHRKMKEKGLSFSQVLDIFGFRVVVDTVPQCYLALGALHATFKPVPGRFKDYIAIPKINSYQSLHTTLVGPFGTPVEFQIRSREMQRIAESGVAAHWLYKAEDESFSDLQKLTHHWLQSLLDIQSTTGDSLEFFEHVKVDLFPDAVYVFTPRGEIRALPRGATVVDYAYMVHTDIGNQAIGANVNNAPAPLRTELQNGDVVEVLTDTQSKPNPNWLPFVRTAKARSEIRHYLRTMEYWESVELGRKLLEQALVALHVDLAGVDPAKLEMSVRDAGVKSLEELHADIGVGKRLAKVEARSLALRIAGKTTAAMLIPRLAPMMIRGNESGAVSYAPCCNPVPGDQIVGHLRGSHGLIVHRRSCKAARRNREKDRERWIDVQWANEAGTLYRTEIEVVVHSERGVLGKIAAEISSGEANIVNVSMEEDAMETGRLQFAVQVRDRVHLAKLLRNLRHLPEVRRVARRH